MKCKYSSQNKDKMLTIYRFIQRDKNAVLNNNRLLFKI